jgi:hypothetical protein
MMNYGVYGLCQLLNQLAEIERDLSQRRQLLDANGNTYSRELMNFADPSALNWLEVNEVDIARARGWLEYAQHQGDILELQPVHDRIEIFNQRLKSQLSLHDFLAEVRTLREAFESGLRFKRFYLYPQAKGQLCIKFEDDWAIANRAFPKAKDDAKAAVDCYGLGHNTASVFHSMRVVEHGLRELAAAVNTHSTNRCGIV